MDACPAFSVSILPNLIGQIILAMAVEITANLSIQKPLDFPGIATPDPACSLSLLPVSGLLLT
jgi:ABC-type dipeptide/oligopeptide/nickel transport system permease subunit